jgi:hypothetical protein
VIRKDIWWKKSELDDGFFSCLLENGRKRKPCPDVMLGAGMHTCDFSSSEIEVSWATLYYPVHPQKVLISKGK